MPIVSPSSNLSPSKIACHRVDSLAFGHRSLSDLCVLAPLRETFRQRAETGQDDFIGQLEAVFCRSRNEFRTSFYVATATARRQNGGQ